jgi:hypothetical protein
LLVDIGCSHVKRITTIEMPYLETRIKALRRTGDYNLYFCVEMFPPPVEKLRTTESQYCYTLQGPPRQVLPPDEVASGKLRVVIYRHALGGNILPRTRYNSTLAGYEVTLGLHTGNLSEQA